MPASSPREIPMKLFRRQAQKLRQLLDIALRMPTSVTRQQFAHCVQSICASISSPKRRRRRSEWRWPLQIRAKLGIFASLLLLQPLDLDKVGEHCSFTIDYGLRYRRVLPHPEAAALRVRRHQRDEGKGAGGAAGCGRPRDGQSRRRHAASHRQQAGRSGAQPAQSSLFRVAGHSPACARKSSSATRRITTCELDPDTEAIVTIGAKDALAHLLFAVIGPGDAVVSPNPAYPIHQYGVIMAEGHACMLPMPEPADVPQPAGASLQHSSRKPKHDPDFVPAQSHHAVRGSGFFPRDRASGGAPRHHDRPRFRLRRSGLRRLPRRPASCKWRARRRSPSRFTRCRRASTWRDGASASAWGTRN